MAERLKFWAFAPIDEKLACSRPRVAHDARVVKRVWMGLRSLPRIAIGAGADCYL